MILLSLVEDDPDEKEIFITFLKNRTDFHLQAFCESGDQLFAYLAATASEQLPDLILLDHNMPRVTGLQVLRKLKSDPDFSRIPVIVYSTYVSAGLAEQCLAAGAMEVYSKPLNTAGYNHMLDLIIERLAPASSR